MRQGQQHRRGRSRGSSGGNGGHNHHHRKGQNPLSRSFESNGPDVKVRGTAADVAAKYMALARDAQSSGDPVLAENYLQHAEHYNRMIIAYREQQMQQNGGDFANGNGQHRMRHMPGVDLSEGEEADGETIDPGMAEQPPMPAFSRQPSSEGQRSDTRHDSRQENGRYDDRRQHQHGRHDHRSERGDNQRSERGDNPRFRDRRFDRNDRAERRGDRSEAQQEQPTPPRDPADQPQPVIETAEAPPPRQQQPRRRERYDMMKDQPEFLRRPVRRPRREEPSAESADGPEAAGDQPEKSSA